jgi:hypothetical protein
MLIPGRGLKREFAIHSREYIMSRGKISQKRRGRMEKRIVLLKKAVDKKAVAEGFCCHGSLIPFSA